MPSAPLGTVMIVLVALSNQDYSNNDGQRRFRDTCFFLLLFFRGKSDGCVSYDSTDEMNLRRGTVSQFGRTNKSREILLAQGIRGHWRKYFAYKNNTWHGRNFANQVGKKAVKEASISQQIHHFPNVCVLRISRAQPTGIFVMCFGLLATSILYQSCAQKLDLKARLTIAKMRPNPKASTFFAPCFRYPSYCMLVSSEATFSFIAQ